MDKYHLQSCGAICFCDSHRTGPEYVFFSADSQIVHPVCTQAETTEAPSDCKPPVNFS